MSYRLESIPPREAVGMGTCVFSIFQDGKITVEIRHTLTVHDLLIFFGFSEGRTVHGYCDFERGCGGLSFDDEQ